MSDRIQWWSDDLLYSKSQLKLDWLAEAYTRGAVILLSVISVFIWLCTVTKILISQSSNSRVVVVQIFSFYGKCYILISPCRNYSTEQNQDGNFHLSFANIMELTVYTHLRWQRGLQPCANKCVNMACMAYDDLFHIDLNTPQIIMHTPLGLFVFVFCSCTACNK